MMQFNDSISPATQTTDYLENLTLFSAFQPILALSHRRVVGHEALLRGRIGCDVIAPGRIFAAADRFGGIDELEDRSQAIHLRTFSQGGAADQWLFLNIEPSRLADQQYRDGRLSQQLQTCGLRHDRLVVEILENKVADDAVLVDAVQYFRELGALVALDDFGAGHSNFDRVWRLKPDIVKLDRSLITSAVADQDEMSRGILTNLVTLLHEAGSLVLAEGVETEDQAIAAIAADADFVQGFYFARPSPDISATPTHSATLTTLTRQLVSRAHAEDQARNTLLDPYITLFQHSARSISIGAQTATANRIADEFAKLLAMPLTLRCYTLDENGEQIAHQESAPKDAEIIGNTRFQPIADTRGGTWFRRSYFRNAISETDRVHVSRPYLSSTGRHMCLTLSLRAAGIGHTVVCCDLLWTDSERARESSGVPRKQIAR